MNAVFVLFVCLVRLVHGGISGSLAWVGLI
jgi:hypothetical protein